MAYADTDRVENHIKDILNAVQNWGGIVASKRRSHEAIEQARIESGMDILRAIASNPQNGYHGNLATLVTVTHNQKLPPFDGLPGIPLIQVYQVPDELPLQKKDPKATPDGPEVAGVPADPDEIDSYRLAPQIYTGGWGGEPTPHDQADPTDMPSEVAGLYAIVNGFFKFTGAAAKIPLITLTWDMANLQVPEAYEPTLVKLSIPKLVKEGDNLSAYASAYAQAGMIDLQEIRSGAENVSPIPDLATAQKAGLT
jgi:hypothetical protein